MVTAIRLSHAESTASVVQDARQTHEYRTQAFCWGWRSFGALVGLLGGIFAALLGSVFTALSWIIEANGNGAYMQKLGTIFLVLTIPLLVLGAHCLDLVEKGKRKQIGGRI